MAIKTIGVILALCGLAFVSHWAWVERHQEKERTWIERREIKQEEKERCRAEKRHFCWLPGVK